MRIGPDLPVVRLRAVGSARPDEAWSRYAHPARWPEWSPQIGHVESSAERIAPGVRGTVRAALGPVGVRFTVLEVDDDLRSWLWRVVPLLGPSAGSSVALPALDLQHAVVDRDGGCATTLDIRPLGWAGLPLAVAYAPLALVALRRLVRP